MKTSIKICTLVLVLVLALAAFTACNFPIKNTTSTTTTTPAPCTHEGGNATCTEQAICEKCNEAYGEALGHDYVDGKCTRCEAADPEYVAPHEHSYEATVTAPTCEAAGYTTYTCSCGDTYTADETEALGHDVVADAAVDPTCTETGLTAGEHCTRCDYKVEQTTIEALGHDVVADAAVDPTCTETGLTAGEHCTRCDYKVEQTTVEALGHDVVVDAAVDATCKEAGLTAGEHCTRCDYKVEQTTVDALGHVDANLDIDCDREGCTGKVAPAGDSLLSNFTANNLGSKISTSSMYYVEGTIVEVLDAKNGIFLIDDGTGEKFYFRLPKNAEGVSHASWEVKLVLGDVVRVYGKINKFSTKDAPNGQYWPAIQGGTVTLLEQHAHVPTAEATCTEKSVCTCGYVVAPELGHVDANGDNICDRCPWNMLIQVETILTQTKDPNVIYNSTAKTMTWNGTEFSVMIGKGNASTYNAVMTYDHQRWYKGNELVITPVNGAKIVCVVITSTSSTYAGHVKTSLEAAGYTVTVDGAVVSVELDSVSSFTLVNTSSTGRIMSVSVHYLPGTTHEHSYTSEVTAPTCEAAGYTTYTCECGHSYTADEVVALGHKGYEADFLCDACNKVVEPAADSTLTLEQANALGLLVTKTQNKYYVTGTVKNIANTFYGNIYITDGTHTFYIYGTKSADGSVAYSNFETPVYVGDTVIMYGYISLYEGSAQIKDAWMTSCVHEHAYSEATCEKLATCSCGLTQGELADHDFKDGICTVCNAADPNFEGEVTVTVGRADFETAGNAAGSYAERKTASGWVGTNCALLSGGTTDTNPKFIFIGDEATKAMTLNGKTSAVGKLVSPTLANGISKLSFNYGHAFSDKNGVDITINIIQNGVVVASYHLDNNTVTQKTAYEFTWTLEEEVKGDFSIEILNNSPSNSSSGNKDRVSIWNLEWLSN